MKFVELPIQFFFPKFYKTLLSSSNKLTVFVVHSIHKISSFTTNDSISRVFDNSDLSNLILFIKLDCSICLHIEFHENSFIFQLISTGKVLDKLLETVEGLLTMIR